MASLVNSYQELLQFNDPEQVRLVRYNSSREFGDTYQALADAVTKGDEPATRTLTQTLLEQSKGRLDDEFHQTSRDIYFRLVSAVNKAEATQEIPVPQLAEVVHRKAFLKPIKEATSEQLYEAFSTTENTRKLDQLESTVLSAASTIPDLPGSYYDLKTAIDDARKATGDDRAEALANLKIATQILVSTASTGLPKDLPPKDARVQILNTLGGVAKGQEQGKPQGADPAAITIEGMLERGAKIQQK